VPSRRYPYPQPYGVPVLFCLPGRQQASSESGVSSLMLRAVGTDTPFEDVRSPLALSDTASLRGRTGRLRRTVRNPLRSDRFLSQNRVACHLKFTVGNSGRAFERWCVAQSDGAYPRRERRGIAPVQPISARPGTAVDRLPPCFFVCVSKIQNAGFCDRGINHGTMIRPLVALLFTLGLMTLTFELTPGSERRKYVVTFVVLLSLPFLHIWVL